MAARFLVVAAVAVLVAGGLSMTSKQTRAQAVSQADAVIRDVCRSQPFSANPALPGAFSTVFAVRVTNAGTTVSEGPVVAGISQLITARGKRDLVPVTSGPLQPGQAAQFKWKDSRLFPGVQMVMIAAFDRDTNPNDASENGLMYFADPWAVPAC